MRRIILPLFLFVSVLALVASTAPRAAAHGDDDSDETEIRIQAPLDAVDCAAMTVSVLGLTIDIHSAVIVGDDDCEDDDDGEDDDGEDDDGEDGDLHDGDDDGDSTLTCAALVPGRAVGVRLASDVTPLAATEVRQADELDDEDDEEGEDEDQEVEIEAPVQDIDGTAETIRLLGLTVDVSDAEFEGDDDFEDHDDTEGDDDSEGDDRHGEGDDDDCGDPVDLSDLIVGQFVEVELASSHPPFSATEVEIQNFSNQVQVVVESPDGQPVGDSMNDLTVDVVTKVRIPKTSTAASNRRSRPAVRVLRLHGSATDGTFTLIGLPSGRAKIVVTGRTAAGVSTGRSKVNVIADETVPARVRLKKPRAH